MSMDYALHRKSQLDTRELLLLESEVKNQGKNMFVAYILWYFLGIVGGHRFYMKKIGTAVTQLILSLTVVGLIVTGIWWIVDAFLVHTWVKQHNAEVENRIIDRIFYDRGRSPEFPI
ncbi:Predicted membrane protein [Paenibacillus barengoltzii J12]|uniref:Predicted membrane protein n=2 Tax=Paenibacillus TaxID=44249 RepID=A0ABY1LSB0_9BACL|nr:MULTISPECIES: TM2 domain-containing protein [Paenibacillus]MEC2346788.1 TM2 domain-containing protein [Paenibacillus barengoltzii]SME94129.1 Predicted membrane protein [Paenibacillus barengoltzii J12]SMF15327.1 Predicted membrane protein [Paenibacillus barengoltzii]